MVQLPMFFLLFFFTSKQLIPIHHMEAHALTARMIERYSMLVVWQKRQNVYLKVK